MFNCLVLLNLKFLVLSCHHIAKLLATSCIHKKRRIGQVEIQVERPLMPLSAIWAKAGIPEFHQKVRSNNFLIKKTREAKKLNKFWTQDEGQICRETL